MSNTRRRRYADYLPPERHADPPGPEQVFGTPRPGYGTVYVHQGRDLDRNLVWEAEWVDEYPNPDHRGASVGVERVTGNREHVIAWARTRPATSFLWTPNLPDPGASSEWAPLPMSDDEIAG